MDENQQDSTESTRLNTRQRKVIEAIVSGANVSEAARKAGVNRTTVYLWIRDNADFNAELNFARREFAEGVRGQLAKVAKEAVNTLVQIMRDEKISPANRLRAAMYVIQSIGAKEASIDAAKAMEQWRNESLPLSVLESTEEE